MVCIKPRKWHSFSWSKNQPFEGFHLCKLSAYLSNFSHINIGVCEDQYDTCPSYASYGDCIFGDYVNWMMENCKKSCGKCETTTTKPPTTGKYLKPKKGLFSYCIIDI